MWSKILGVVLGVVVIIIAVIWYVNWLKKKRVMARKESTVPVERGRCWCCGVELRGDEVYCETCGQDVS